MPLDLAFSLKIVLSSQLLLNPLRNFDDTWHKGRSQCGGVNIIRGALSNQFKRSYIPGLSFFIGKCIVFATENSS
jgi:hypothetical protein